MKAQSFAFTLALFGALGCGSDTGAGPADAAPSGRADAAPPDAGSYVPGTPLSVTVGGVFPAGTLLRDQYTGTPVTVAANGTVTVNPDPNGVVLLEKDGVQATPFKWANLTVYHAMVDRYVNGDSSNDLSYGRKKDGAMEIGTWHGGDWKGLTSKLDYLAALGVDAIWITPIVEQAHGWSGGGNGDFKHWAYHGYWALDFTRLDQNFGTQAELQALVDGAHRKGIRVLVDVVLNHPGYATGADLLEVLPEVFFDKTGNAFKSYDLTATSSLHAWNNLVNYNSDDWVKWWTPRWIRAGFPGFDAPGRDDETMQLSSLPDFKTEATQAADVPTLFTRKADTAFVEQPGFTVRQYLIKWHTDWVRQLGIDGFRVDTVKNVDVATFKALKTAGVQALQEWKTQNPSKKLDDAPFWMTAEVFGHGVAKDKYYSDGGFDSVINFDFQRNLTDILQANPQLAASAAALEALYAGISSKIAGDPSFGIVSYVSSHDTRLNFDFFMNNAVKQRHAGTALLLAPGGVEIFYGDESGRRAGPAGSDPQQGTRSDMNFASTDESILSHWQKLAGFRHRHAAVGGGTHQKLESLPGTYAFSRKLDSDAVIVILTNTR